MDAYDSFNFTHAGRKFTAELHYDSDHGAPWLEADGHGEVSDWTTRDKKPGELILSEDRRSKRFYDLAETIRTAKADGWGLNEEKLAKLAKRLGRTPTAKQITHAAVMADYEHLRAWCNDEWHWCGVVVREVVSDDDDDDDDTSAADGPEESLWGVESNSEEYLHEVACELAEQLISEIVK